VSVIGTALNRAAVWVKESLCVSAQLDAFGVGTRSLSMR
jgi:hypothetical protein